MSDCFCPLKRAALETPDALAFVSEEKKLTFQQLDAITENFCLKLHQSHIQPGDRIAILHPPSVELICLIFAVLRLGACPCLINLRLPPAQIEAQIAQIAPKLWISSFPWDLSPLKTPKACPVPGSILLFTSGSTGTPKIAVLSLKSLIANAAHSIPLEMGDRYLLSLPLYHVGGLGILLRCVLKRATLVLEKNDPEITHLSFVPTQMYRASPVYKNLKCVLLGGAPISHIPPKLPIFATYGLTEMGSMVFAQKNPIQKEGLFYLKDPLPQRKVRIAEDGEIWVGGDTLFQGYLENERISSPITEGWFPTGDIGKKDEILGYAILGRKDWQFISGGENIQPEEIESHLLKIPGILEAVVVPQEDPEYGNRPVACIQTLKNPFRLAEIRAILKEHLPKYKIPVAIHIFPEIPKIGVKIDRKKIIDLFLKNS